VATKRKNYFHKKILNTKNYYLAGIIELETYICSILQGIDVATKRKNNSKENSEHKKY
jgi:hypothetical protein